MRVHLGHTVVSWGIGAPMELIRFAGANRLKVEIDYRPEKERPGVRLVAPDSFRRTRESRLVLFIVNDAGALRSHRVDRIARVAVTRTLFCPRYAVEFQGIAMGTRHGELHMLSRYGSGMGRSRAVRADHSACPSHDHPKNGPFSSPKHRRC